MCGIYGEIVLTGDKPDEAIVRAMGASIVHRGPDDDGLYTDGEAAIGLRRLSIIDVGGGRQPLFNEDKSIAIVCNGEIYNFRELRVRLTGRGHSFLTGSDAWVAAGAWVVEPWPMFLIGSGILILSGVIGSWSIRIPTAS